VTVDENAVAGGAGSAVNECLAAHDVQISVLNLGLPDTFFQHGGRGDMLRESGLDHEGIIAAVEMFRTKGKRFAAQA
jgi:1-deoxy-D-xylulose-5-phosphate synthase